jgi:hypothetical protein
MWWKLVTTSIKQRLYTKIIQQRTIYNKIGRDAYSRQILNWYYATAAWWIWVFRIKILVAKDLCDKSISQDRKIALEEMIWLAVHFITYNSSTIPIYQCHISDIRFWKPRYWRRSFCALFDDHESERIIGTYTAYNGHTILPKWSLLKIFIRFV